LKYWSFGVEVRASSWVGRVTLGDLTITVRSKISGLPFLNLLRYAYSLRDLAMFAPTGYAASAETFQDLIIEQLTNEATSPNDIRSPLSLHPNETVDRSLTSRCLCYLRKSIRLQGSERPHIQEDGRLRRA
jgi:hypothetical protein